MRLPRFELVAPKSMNETLRFLKEHRAETKIMSGGTDLLPSMKQGIFCPRYLLSLDSIPDLSGVALTENAGLRMGSMTRLHALETDPIINDKFPMISRTAHTVASPQLRRMGTLGGNLSLDTRCNYYNQTGPWRKCRPTCIKMGGDVCNAIGGGKKCFAAFSGDLAPALIALKARVRLSSSEGERVIPLLDYYSGDGANPLTRRPDEIMLEVEVPPLPEDAFTVYHKFRIRESIDFPFAGVAVMIEMEGKEKVCRKADIVIGAVGTRPEKIKGIEDLLEGKLIQGPLIEEAANLAFKAAKPVANLGSSPEYRRIMINSLVRKALGQVMTDAP